MNKVYITYTTDGYNDQVVDCVFSSYEAAYLYVVGQTNPNLTGDAFLAFSELPSTKEWHKKFIHSFDIIK